MLSWLKNPALALGFLVVFAGTALLSPHAAAAADPIQVSGAVEGGGTFEGAVTNPMFTNFEEAVGFSGTVEGIATVDGVEITVSQQFDILAFVSDRSDCQTIFYSVDPIQIEAIGSSVQLDQVTMEKARSGLIGGLLGGDAVCVVSDLLGDDNGDIDRLVDFLNDVLGN